MSVPGSDILNKFSEFESNFDSIPLIFWPKFSLSMHFYDIPALALLDLFGFTDTVGRISMIFKLALV